MTPTAEQIACLEIFKRGEDLTINAFAGAGKTSTLKLLAGSTDRAGVYLAFNKAAAEEAKKKMPKNVTCSTIHSLAFKAMVGKYGVPKMTGKLSAQVICETLKINGKMALGPGSWVTARQYGNLIKACLATFQHSGDDIIYPDHAYVPTRLLSEDDRELSDKQREYIKAARERVAEFAIIYWARALDKNTAVPLGHDGYLKAWALTKPRIQADFIMLDEAQDSNGVTIRLIENQTAQVITVGDPYQQIYTWRGAMSAMGAFNGTQANLTQSFRFGQGVADYANEVLVSLQPHAKIRGFEKLTTALEVVENPDAIICRTNAGVLSAALGVMAAGRAIYIPKGLDEMAYVLDAIESLQNNREVTYPVEFIGFKNWREVVALVDTEGDPDLDKWVRLMDKFSIDELRAVIASGAKMRPGAVSLVTGHASKGLEWANVRLSDDFLLGHQNPDQMNSEEIRLFYVAATRAMSALEVPSAMRAAVNEINAAFRARLSVTQNDGRVAA